MLLAVVEVLMIRAMAEEPLGGLYLHSSLAFEAAWVEVYEGLRREDSLAVEGRIPKSVVSVVGHLFLVLLEVSALMTLEVLGLKVVMSLDQRHKTSLVRLQYLHRLQFFLIWAYLRQQICHQAEARMVLCWNLRRRYSCRYCSFLGALLDHLGQEEPIQLEASVIPG